MNRLSLLGLAAVLAAAGIAAAQGTPAQHAVDMKGMHDHMMKGMDANGDGKISKDEFMRFHEAMFDKMKGQDGTIAVKDMQMDCPMMQGDGKAMGHGGTMGHGQGMMGGETKK